MHRITLVYLKRPCPCLSNHIFINCLPDCKTQEIKICSHISLASILISNGLFPSGPSWPGYAYNIDLLNLYLDLMRTNGSSAESLAEALHEQQRANGYILRNTKNQPIQEGFRRTLQRALQWYDLLRGLADQETRKRIAVAKEELLYPTPAPAPTKRGAPVDTSAGGLASPPITPHQDTSAPDGRRWQKQGPHPSQIWMEVAAKLGLSVSGRKVIAQYLVGRCPTCFAIGVVGVPLTKGCDIQCASDGNFSHRHNESAGDGPTTNYAPESMVPKEFIDAVGAALDACRTRPARKRRGDVPEAAVKQCEKSHTAANGSRQKAASDRHDDRGLMALVCRHDIPIFVCNIDTPGEQQKYSIGLLIWLLLHLPDIATVMNLYDVGCVADKAVRSCQLVYSPRLKEGLGLTDGEGVERLWSRLRKLISILRGVHRKRRIILLDRHLQWIADKMRDDLGKWLVRKWVALRDRERAASREVQRSGHTATMLREQWASQREIQLSVRRMTAPRLKKELEAVMELQDQIQSVEEAIATAEASLRDPGGDAGPTLIQLTQQADALYSSLNVEEVFPEIQDFGNDFVRTLIMAYDAKCIARRKLIGRFFEWEYLDQAVGGTGEPLGTNQHQKVVQAIQRRAPATMGAINRYNDLCGKLRALLPPGREFPLPEPLSTELSKLKNDPALLEDVWVSALPTSTALWLTDKTVRVAIRAQLVLDRCVEERERLQREEKQLFAWLQLEARAVARALYDPSSMFENRHIFLC
ncbi:hypothetical protein AURDEDRAFT_76862 [Auricularia subglabra TFB-10046 SS5]|uniref:CxC1-like cysteine cluster associated with KDZ transposases domain-containing protein n=1 Tax=Auricularia subglabra (strain TFB-10046 / SS5) TaxID=717982 RepID=J0D4F3_AURST|nr:hypothetical protein AURDEDRAFT_76862 [Auricularia subglabra TFB-10046 SS5]